VITDTKKESSSGKQVDEAVERAAKEAARPEREKLPLAVRLVATNSAARCTSREAPRAALFLAVHDRRTALDEPSGASRLQHRLVPSARDKVQRGALRLLDTDAGVRVVDLDAEDLCLLDNGDALAGRDAVSDRGREAAGRAGATARRGAARRGEDEG